MINFLKLMFIQFIFVFFSISAFSVDDSLLEDKDVENNNYLSLHLWDPSNLPYGTDGHISMSIVNGDNTNYISLHQGNQNGNFFNPDWASSLQDDAGRLGKQQDSTVKIFSLKRNNIIQWFNQHKSPGNDIRREHYKYHRLGDTLRDVNFCHNRASIIVDLLIHGGIRNLFLPLNQEWPPNQNTWFDTSLAAAKCAVIGAPTVGAAVIAGPAVVTAVSASSLPAIAGATVAGGGGVIAEE